MAKISEFKGLRPRKDSAHLIAELPYDVVDSKEARAIAQKNEFSFYHVLKPEVGLNEDINIYDDIVYETGRKRLRRFIDEGIFRSDDTPRLYLYSMIDEGRIQTGLVACVHISDYINNVIKKHELTIEEKERDRMRHIDNLNANTGLVFLFYREDDKLKGLFERAIQASPEYDFTTNDGIRHIFRIISDEKLISAFKECFKDKALFIADGHHRAASAVGVGLKRKEENPNHIGDEGYNWFLSVIFPHDQLKIMAYNRVVRDLNGYSITAFLNILRERFDVTKLDEHILECRHRFCMYLDGDWYKLISDNKDFENSIESTDTKILHDTILDPILGIKKPREDKRLDFVGGIKGVNELQRLVDCGEYQVAFSLYPISIEEIIRISEMGGVLPPKSTWFEPKLRSGLVIHLL
ncbi:MAG: DUF1015 family protein [Spirochaetota bacterium]|nr:DUF1015 family protein [Spirochaetota bacterium]